MARKLMVTRTFLTTRVNVLCLDVERAEPFNQEITLPRVFSDERKLMKEVHARIDSDTVKAVHIVSLEKLETLYGMDEDTFIQHAQVLPPRKPNRDVLRPMPLSDITTD